MKDSIVKTKIETNQVEIPIDFQFQQEIDDLIALHSSEIKRVKIGSIRIDF